MEDEKFVFKKIESPELLEEVYKLRYQVYCKEANFIKEEDYPQKSESDEFDKHSVHFGAFNPDNLLVGTVRLILPVVEKFPIEEHCSILNFDRESIKRSESVEISRLTISKQLRRRNFDGLYYEPHVQDKSVEDRNTLFMRRVRPMAFGLYRAIYQECKRTGIKHWFALMERTLWLLLKIHGFVFEPIGPEVDFYGMVTPYVSTISEIEKNVHEKFPQFYEYFMKGLEPDLHPKFE